MIQTGKIIKVKNLIAFYNGFPVNRQVSFQLDYGEICILIGDNGSGKTSILKVLTAQLQSYSGDISIFGISPKNNHLWSFVNFGIHYISQFPTSPNFLTVAKIIQLHENLLKRQSDIFLDFDIYDYLDKTSINLKKDFGSLSFGQRRILEIGIAFHTKPRLIMADEPIAGMSNLARELILETISNYVEKRGIIIATAHKKEFVISQNQHSINIFSAGEFIGEK